jgi:2-polyprenyl-6-methoxyphenol hydroxylase-like FAD-dependent oxidoreductase
MPETTPRALIVGGSMAGLFCGVLLRAAGWEVDIYERAGDELASRGAGIATHDELYAAFVAAGIDLRAEMGVQSEGRIVLDRAGSVLGECAMPQIMTSWGFVFRFLRARFPDRHYHKGCVLEGLAQDGNGVEARFGNGERVRADWVIGADGTRSTVRHCVLPDAVPRYCGYFAWRGLIDETRVPPAVLARVAYRMAFGPAPRGHWLGYLVAGPGDDLRPGRRWYNWGWYRRADPDALAAHLTDASGRHYPLGIPHDRMQPALVAAMRREAHEELAPPIQRIVEATARPYIQGIYEVESPRLVCGRVVLIGDAAFTARPHVGLGVSKAADDARTLAAALGANDRVAALAAWETERLRYGRAAVQWGRDLGSYIEHPDAAEPGLRAKVEHYRQATTLMLETASNSPARHLARLLDDDTLSGDGRPQPSG